MAFTLRQRLAPPGQHRAMLLGIEDGQGQYGPVHRFVFRVADGPHAGCELIRTTGTEYRLGTSLGDLLESLYGRPLAEGETVDPTVDLVGKHFDVFATPASGGSGSIVQTIKPLKNGLPGAADTPAKK